MLDGPGERRKKVVNETESNGQRERERKGNTNEWIASVVGSAAAAACSEWMMNNRWLFLFIYLFVFDNYGGRAYLIGYKEKEG